MISYWCAEYNKHHSNLIIFSSAKNNINTHVQFLDDNKKHELIEYLLLILPDIVDNEYIIYGILGTAYRLNIYDEIKSILYMSGFDNICNECDEYILNNIS